MLPKGFLVGNVATDPQSGVSQNNQRSWTRFSVACNDRFVKTNEGPKVHFFNLVSWERNAKYIKEFVKKGDKVFVEFSISTSQYNNQEGKTIRSIDFRVDNIEKVGSKLTPRPEHTENKPTSDFDSEITKDEETDNISLDEIF